MSSFSNVSGITTMFIRDAQDVTRQLKNRLTFVDFTAGVPINHVPNGNNNYIEFLFGKKECVGSNCPGSPFQLRDVRLFR